MKIMYVDQTGQLGGGEFSLLDIVRLSAHSSEVTLFADGPFREALEGLGKSVHLVAASSIDKAGRRAGIVAMLEKIPSVWKLKNQVAKISVGFDVVYANSQKAFLVCSFAKKRKQLLIWHLRDLLTSDHFSLLLRKTVIFLGNRSADIVIANSHATANAFLEAGGNPAKVTVVHNGISSKSFDVIDNVMVNCALLELGLAGKYLVGVFGRFSPWKGQHILLDAAAQLTKVHVVLVGDALFGEDEYGARLRLRARAPDLAGRVHFLGFRRDIPLLMKCMNVIAHTSVFPEPFGRVIVEGMLAGRPVIASRGGGILEIVRDEETALLVTPGSIEELSAAIERLRMDEGLASRIAVAGHERALEHFTVEAMVEKIDKVIERVVSQSA
jgi:glycosyltransferase involved in cell wall biosynthesis